MASGDTESITHQIQKFGEWIKNNVMTVEYLKRNCAPFDIQKKDNYVLSSTVASLFAKMFVIAFKGCPAEKLPLPMCADESFLKNLFAKAFNLFAHKYVFPIYRVASKLISRLYPKGFPKFHPIHLLLETHLDFCIARRWRFRPKATVRVGNGGEGSYINLENFDMVIFWIFNTGIKECHVPVESDEYFQKLDDAFAKDTRRKRMNWSIRRSSNEQELLFEKEDSSDDENTDDEKESNDDVPDLSPIQKVRSTTSIEILHKRFIEDLIDSAKGSIFPTNVVNILNAFNNLVTCVTDYWAFVASKIASVMIETKSEISFLYETCANFNTSTLNDYLLVIENDPIKHFIEPFGFDQQRYESFLDHITNMFLKEIVLTKEFLQKWYDEGKESIEPKDFEILKYHIDNFISKFEALTNQSLV